MIGRRLLAACVLLLPALAGAGPAPRPLDQFAPVPPKRVLDAAALARGAANQVTHDVRLPAEYVLQRRTRQDGVKRALGIDGDSQVLFGDLHVHTTYSDDAFWFSLPLIEGTTGMRPPTSACNYARFVSQLDFFAITDHAESYTPQFWRNTVEAVRQCNAVARDPANPDVVAFLGYEWTAIGKTAAEHYGHHNVIFRDLDERSIPKRPVAYSQNIMGLDPSWAEHDRANRSYYDTFQTYLSRYRKVPLCAPGVATTRLPDDCFEFARTPGELFAKLRELGAPVVVIPHGMAWGFSQPLDTTWHNALAAPNFDNTLVRAIEIFSGHGNSEQYLPIAARKFDASGKPYCPEPTPQYLPACWRAGEIIRERCLRAGLDGAECTRREREARQNFVDVNSRAGWLTVPNTTVEDWLDAGQARGVFLPPLNYRPGRSTQAALALTAFDRPDDRRFLWAFIGSSDTHRAMAGFGFKQFNRTETIDITGGRSLFFSDLLMQRTGGPRERAARSIRLPPDDTRGLVPHGGIETERNSSFAYVGGIAAVHARGRSREAIWDAIQRREVYATSGPRILLWFDLVDAGAPPVPMGSHVRRAQPPRFRVRAAGSERQLGGCPPEVTRALAARGLEDLARGECYHPSNARYALDRVEVVRIRPQTFEGEPIERLIDDPWKTLDCGMQPTCEVEFSDPGFDRDSLYYVRVLEEPTMTINGATLRTRFDAQGRAVAVDPCFPGYPTSAADDCRAPAQQRAWSSPIYADFTGGR